MKRQACKYAHTEAHIGDTQRHKHTEKRDNLRNNVMVETSFSCEVRCKMQGSLLKKI